MSSSTSMPRRPLGKTGEQVSLIGLGGSHLSVPDESTAIGMIRSALDQGVNFIDNAWDYSDGESERRVGKALKDGYRDKAFVMTKFDAHNREGARIQIEDSLRRLQVDTIDLLQIHEVIRPDDPERIFAEGAIEALLEAQSAGKTRYIGFTGHKDPNIHLKMLETARTHGVAFDTVQIPLNVMDAHVDGFERKVLPVLLEREIGVLGMKPMGGGYILESGVVTPTECLYYAMNLPTAVVITGCDSPEILEQALVAARTFRPMDREQIVELLARTARASESRQFEPYKTEHGFDGTYSHPQWLEWGAETVHAS